MNSDFTRKIAASQNLRQGGKNPIESANAVEPELSETDNLDRQIIINISGDYIAGDKPMGDKVQNKTVQNNSDEAQGSQVIVEEGGIAYVGETRIYNATPGNSSPDDISALFGYTTLPENVVSLSIKKTDCSQYNIRAYYVFSGEIKRIDCVLMIVEINPLLEDDMRIFRSNLSPANLLGGLDRYHNRLRRFPPISRLLQWLSKWHSFGTEDTILEVNDCDELGISWESIEIDKIPLGVSMQIVRHDTENSIDSLNNLSYSEHYCEGRILAHTTSTTCSWQTKYQHQCFSIFKEFTKDLHKPTTEYGLVLIDGFCSEDSIDRDPTTSIKHSKLFADRASIVLISGQLKFCTSIKMKHQEFLKLFHTHGAKGVIGALRFFDVTISTKVMGNFFNLLEQQREDTRLTVPEMLRMMRRDAYELLRDAPDDDPICSLYLATFEYIYYGNPFTTLQLTRANI
jgi:hypothetical protein